SGSLSTPLSVTAGLRAPACVGTRASWPACRSGPPLRRSTDPPGRRRRRADGSRARSRCRPLRRRCRSTSLLLASFRPASRALRPSRIIPGRYPGADRDRPTTSTRRRVDRQRHAELRAPGAAIDFDLTAVPQNEPPGDVEPEADALADRLRREEGVEDALAD